MSRQYIYQVENLTKKHGQRVVLDDIWLAFYPGAKIGVLGPNGAGKSTLMDVYPPETIFKNIDDIVTFHFHPASSDEYWKARKSAETVATDKYLNHLATSQHKNLAIETTGNWYGSSWAADLLQQGFTKVIVLCVFVNSVDEIWKRVQRSIYCTSRI